MLVLNSESQILLDESEFAVVTSLAQQVDISTENITPQKNKFMYSNIKLFYFKRNETDVNEELSLTYFLKRFL